MAGLEALRPTQAMVIRCFRRMGEAFPRLVPPTEAGSYQQPGDKLIFAPGML